MLAANQSQRSPVTNDPIDASLDAGRALRKAGKLDGALREFQHALGLARAQKNAVQTARSLLLVATVELLSFRYQSALAAAKEALEMARTAGDYTLAGGASGTVSSIYMQLGDFITAETEGKRAIALLKLAPAGEPHARDFLVRAFHTQAVLCYVDGKIAEGENFFQEAIALAERLGDRSLEALSWDMRGIALLRNNQFEEAEQSLEKSFALRTVLQDRENLPISQEHLAELELKRPQPNYPFALKLVDEAFSSHSAAFETSPQFYPIHIRARILLGTGEKQKALAEFRRAVRAAESWRRGALPGDIANTQTVFLLDEIYRDFAHLAAEISLETNNGALRDEAWQALAANRAASLRGQLELALAGDAKLPPIYFQKLAALQTAQARVTLGPNSKVDEANLARIRTEIDDQENQIAIKIGKNYFSQEKNPGKNSLRNIQSRLRDGQLLLSFSLGDTKSYLWAVSGDQVNLYQIDGRQKLVSAAVQLTKGVRAGTDTTELGRNLSRALFGALPARLARKPEWLIAADGDLLNGVPFGALPGGTGRLLIEEHSLRFPPSELLLASSKGSTAAPRFLAVADPIYNQADRRIDRRRDWAPGPMEASSVTLARLAGSGQEARSSARESGLADQQILDGVKASADSLRKALVPPPQLLHFAVHVVSPPGRSQEAALALSLKDGVPELLTPEAIATFRLAGGLVVLSGCSSGQGKAVPSAGLLGLSRAWLLAGAEAVVASAWPTPDDSGRFFSLFYSHLHAAKSGSLSQRAAFALAQTQLELQRGGGYTGSPSYWAAYWIVSKE